MPLRSPDSFLAARSVIHPGLIFLLLLFFSRVICRHFELFKHGHDLFVPFAGLSNDEAISCDAHLAALAVELNPMARWPGQILNCLDQTGFPCDDDPLF